MRTDSPGLREMVNIDTCLQPMRQNRKTGSVPSDQQHAANGRNDRPNIEKRGREKLHETPAPATALSVDAPIVRRACKPNPLNHAAH
jgi:hypothetical protein